MCVCVCFVGNASLLMCTFREVCTQNLCDYSWLLNIDCNLHINLNVWSNTFWSCMMTSVVALSKIVSIDTCNWEHFLISYECLFNFCMFYAMCA